MTLTERAARALDATHDAAARKVGIRTDEYREYLAAYLDGRLHPLNAKAKAIRVACCYLEMIVRTDARDNLVNAAVLRIKAA